MSDTVDITFERDQACDGEIAKGVWRRFRQSAMIKCGKCGAIHRLTSWRIDGAGKVTPSLVCLADGCRWHANVTLKDWTIAR